MPSAPINKMICGCKSKTKNQKERRLVFLNLHPCRSRRGIVRQAIADSSQPLQDGFAYYMNDGVHGAFNNLLFDHATVHPRKLRNAIFPKHQIVEVIRGKGENALRTIKVVEEEATPYDETLYPSTVFGPTCDSMDVLI